MCDPGGGKVPEQYDDGAVHLLLYDRIYWRDHCRFPLYILGVLEIRKAGPFKKERKKTRGIVFWVSMLFFAGVFFGYFILTPFMVNFYFNYTLSDKVVVFPNFSDYLENLIYTTVGIGVLFQMPLLIMVLARVGIVTSKFLRKYRRHALVVILLAAAIITPTTDPFSLGIVTIPLYLLYEAGISIAARINRRQEKQTKEWS